MVHLSRCSPVPPSPSPSLPLPLSQIHCRGVYPGGGGEVEFSCPVVRRMRPAQMMDCGKVRRIRGVAYPLYILYTTSNQQDSCCWNPFNQDTRYKDTSIEQDSCCWNPSNQDTRYKDTSIEQDSCCWNPSNQDTRYKDTSIEQDSCCFLTSEMRTPL